MSLLEKPVHHCSHDEWAFAVCLELEGTEDSFQEWLGRIKEMRSRVLWFAAMILGISMARSQWVHTNGPCGGVANSLVADRADYLACVGGDVFRSTDDGATWTPGSSEIHPNFLVAGNAGVYALTGGAGVLFSTDGGFHWTAINNGLPSLNVQALSVVGKNLFVSILNHVVNAPDYGIFRSNDNGAHWTSANNGLTNTSVTTFASFVTMAGDTSILAGTWGGVFVSTNGGDSWTATGLADIGVQALAISSSEAGETVVIAGTYHGIFRSLEGLGSWVRGSSGLTDTLVSALAVSSNGSGEPLFFAGTEGGSVFRSTDDGATWKNASSGLIAGTWDWGGSVHALAVIATKLFACTYAGIFRSTDNGEHWEPSNSGIPLVAVNTLLPVSSEAGHTAMMAGTFPSGIFLSSDNGSNWVAVNNGITGINVSALAVKGPGIFAGTGSGVFRSTDMGLSWASTGLTNTGDVVSMLAVPGGNKDTNIIAGTWSGAFISSDDGETWNSLGVGGTVTAIAVDTDSSGGTNIFAGTRGSGVYLSSDFGSTWVSLHNGIPVVTDINAFCFAGNTLFAATEYSLYETSDNGVSWSPTGLNTSLISSNTFVFSLAAWTSAGVTTLFAGTNDHGVMVSTDNGATWNFANAGLEDMCVYSLAVGGSNLFAGTNVSGVWVRKLSELTAVQETTPIQAPRAFSLSQNYPNPFNPTTTIRFSIPKQSYVTLTVFNELSQKVAELVNGDIETGYHEAQFDGTNLASGVYLYRLQSGSFVQTRKLLLLK